MTMTEDETTAAQRAIAELEARVADQAAERRARRSGRPYGVRSRHTNQMTLVELARVWADHFGYTAKEGGWIYDERDRHVVQGWEAFAERLRSRGYIKVGTGVDWRRVDLAKQAGRNWRP